MFEPLFRTGYYVGGMNMAGNVAGRAQEQPVLRSAAARAAGAVFLVAIIAGGLLLGGTAAGVPLAAMGALCVVLAALLAALTLAIVRRTAARRAAAIDGLVQQLRRLAVEDLRSLQALAEPSLIGDERVVAELPETAELAAAVNAVSVRLRNELASLSTEQERAVAIRRDFVGNVSHELRTPLASLKALVETLEEGALDDPGAAREFLNQMHVEVDSLAQLVQELLDLSRIESGQATLRPERLSPTELANDAARRLLVQAERAGIRLVLDTPPDVPDVVADPGRVMQVLINLLHNAIKFTPEGGQISLTVRPHPEGALFSVHDTGIGFSADALPRLFERFYKVDRSRASFGTGLGLAIAKHIVQAHGGRIWAESPGIGKGATFSFTLPVTAVMP